MAVKRKAPTDCWRKGWLLSLLLAHFISIVLSSVQENLQRASYEELPLPIKSEFDWNQYRAVRLGNGISVLAIHSEEFKKSGCCLNVKGGRFDDYKYGKGTAELVVHELFEECTRRQDTRGFTYITCSKPSEYGTVAREEHSEYSFSVPHANFESTMRNFSKAFIAPKFLLQADTFDLEFEKGGSRGRVQKATLIFQETFSSHSPEIQNPLEWIKRVAFENSRYKNLPQRYFVAEREEGNFKYARNVRDFWNSKYFGKNMTLVVYGKEKLDRLVQLAAQNFGAIRSEPSRKEDRYGMPFEASELGTISYIKCECHESHLAIWWQLPIELVAREIGSEEYLVKLIKSEHNGSIIESLEARSLANTLNCSCEKHDEFALFTISVGLTKKGEKETNEVLKIIAAYVNLLRKNSLQRWLLEESNACETIKFHFSTDDGIEEQAEQYAKNLHYYSSLHALGGHAVTGAVSPEATERILAQLKLSNMQIFIMTKKGELIDEKDGRAAGSKHAKTTGYSKYEIDANLAEEFSKIDPQKFPDLHLPRANPYIPTKINGATDDVKESRAPVELIPGILWLYQSTGTKFLRSKVSLLLHIPNISCNYPRHVVLGQIFATCFSKKIQSSYFSATLTMYKFLAKFSQTGFELKVLGFTEKLNQLVQDMVRLFFEYVPPENLFEEVAKGLRHNVAMYFNQSSTTEEVTDLVKAHLMPGTLNQTVLGEGIQEITYKDMQEFCKLIDRKDFSIAVLAAGNTTSEGAFELIKGLNLPHLRPVPFNTRMSILEAKEKRRLYERHEDRYSAVSIFLQFPFKEKNPKLRILAAVFALMFYGRCWEEVECTDDDHTGHLNSFEFEKLGRCIGISCIMETDRRNCAACETTILNILASSLNRFKTSEVDPPDFRRKLLKYKIELMSQLINPSYKDSFFYDQIITGQFDFEQIEEQLGIIDAVTYKDLMQFIKDYVMPEGAQRRLISMWLLGYNDPDVDVSDRKRVFECNDLPDLDKLTVK